MLFRCEGCGNISRVNFDMITDWNTKIELKEGKAKCPSCREWCKYKLINCEDWIEDRIFKVKGE